MDKRDNLVIWNAVEKTDPDYTKAYTGPGGFVATSINAEYIIKKATEQFGPVGLGWGWEIIEERYDTGAPLKPKTDDVNMDLEVRAIVHTCKIKLWYIYPGEEKAYIEQYGHTPHVYQNRYGFQTELEAPKKSLTDAIKKALSMLGFAGDVYLGEYDDVNYLEELKREFEVEKADDQDAERERQAAEFREWYAKQKEMLSNAISLNELEQLFKIAVRMLARRNENNKIRELTVIKDEKKTQLSNGEKQQELISNV
ncbi:MAG: hypothetical protein OES84_00005 [Kiritimatiellaceae bacterium]|nr:hypothetical protein [Kiritimatiellaceae bacterium]